MLDQGGGAEVAARDMMKERREVVDTIQGLLHNGELAIEAAFTAIAQLALAMPAARMKARISPIAGQAAFDSVAAAMSGIIEARGHLVSAHGQLDATREQYRMPTATGGGSEKPPRTGIEPALELVRQVAA